MKQKHTKQKKANRSSALYRQANAEQSLRRREKRLSLQPKKKKCFGLQVRRVQHIKLERYNGVRYQIIINIEHAS